LRARKKHFGAGGKGRGVGKKGGDYGTRNARVVAIGPFQKTASGRWARRLKYVREGGEVGKETKTALLGY